MTSENPNTEPLKFSLKLIGFNEITVNCETQEDSSDSLIPDKSSDSIAESEFLSDTMEEKSPSSTLAGGTDPDTNHNQGETGGGHYPPPLKPEYPEFKPPVIDFDAEMCKQNPIFCRNVRIRRRILSEFYTAICIYKAPGFERISKLGVEENSGIKIEGEISVSVIPCLSKEDAKKRLIIHISFRQVNSFYLKAGTFKFFVFTRGEIRAGNEIKFRLFLLKFFVRVLEPIEATCIESKCCHSE